MQDEEGEEYEGQGEEAIAIRTGSPEVRQRIPEYGQY